MTSSLPPTSSLSPLTALVFLSCVPQGLGTFGSYTQISLPRLCMASEVTPSEASLTAALRSVTAPSHSLGPLDLYSI